MVNKDTYFNKTILYRSLVRWCCARNHQIKLSLMTKNTVHTQKEDEFVGMWLAKSSVDDTIESPVEHTQIKNTF